MNHPCFFTPATRSRIVQFILDRKRFSENHHDDFAFGIERLLEEQVYSATYPLHDVSIVLHFLYFNMLAAVIRFKATTKTAMRTYIKSR